MGVTLGQCLAKLPQRHQNALLWFWTRRGTVQPWPLPLPDGTLLASKAKGIYKPAWSPYALSVRQNLGSPYADHDPIHRPDGTWHYHYFQENSNPEERDLEYTNLALLKCREYSVPIGVMRQVASKPDSRYGVLGLALVHSWEAGYFLIEGFNPNLSL